MDTKIEKINNTRTVSICPDTLHYYGTIAKISNNNDISFINRGSVYYLRDNPKDPNTVYHPYLVIQDSYLDKIGKIAVFGITSNPANINMVPIIMKDTIGYINWHQPHLYRLSEFSYPNTKYIGTIANPQAINIAMDLYGLYLGMNLAKSESEIIQEYLDYIDEFKERAKNYSPYTHKVIPESENGKLTLQISFSRKVEEEETQPENNIINDNSNDTIDDIESLPNFEDDDISDNEIDETKDEIETAESSEEVIESEDTANTVSVTDNDNVSGADKLTIIVDTTSEALLTAVSMLEETTSTIPIEENVLNMSMNDVKLFLAYLKFNSQYKAAKLYGRAQCTISAKKRKLEEVYNVVYI